MTETETRCDFCTELIDTTRRWWIYPAPGFAFGVDGGPPQPRKAHACCPTCKPLVDARAWPAILDRLAEAYIARQLARYDERGRAIVVRLGVHRLFVPHWRSEMGARFGRLAEYLGDPVEGPG